jgi:hypothetical protein
MKNENLGLDCLTLIGPGEVKFDLADFDLKLPANLFSNLIIPATTSFKSFWTYDMTSKNDVLTDFLMIFRQKFGRGATLPTPPPSASQHSNQFPVVGCIEGGWWVRSQAYSLALSKWTFGAAPILACSENRRPL